MCVLTSNLIYYTIGVWTQGDLFGYEYGTIRLGSECYGADSYCVPDVYPGIIGTPYCSSSSSSSSSSTTNHHHHGVCVVAYDDNADGSSLRLEFDSYNDALAVPSSAEIQVTSGHGNYIQYGFTNVAGTSVIFSYYYAYNGLEDTNGLSWAPIANWPSGLCGENGGTVGSAGSLFSNLEKLTPPSFAKTPPKLIVNCNKCLRK